MNCQGKVAFAAELLAAIGDAAIDLHKLHKAAAAAALEGRAAEVFGIVSHLLRDQAGMHLCNLATSKRMRLKAGLLE